MGKKENEASKNDEVCTPEDVFGPILRALGEKRFDFDPCSHPDAIIPVKQRVLLPKYEGRTLSLLGGAKKTIVSFGDGLLFDWQRKLVWLNPPYSQLRYPKKYPWLPKAARNCRCVALLPSRTSSRWWQNDVAGEAQMVVFLCGRVWHVGYEWGSPFHQVLAFYGFSSGELDALQAEFDVNLGGKHRVWRIAR